MANNKSIIDMDALYKAGYNSRIDAENASKDRRIQLIDQLFIKAGSWVVDRYKTNHAELKGLKTLGRASNSQIQMEIEKLGGQLTPKMQESLNLYKAEYDKGARMSVKGFSRKKKEEGQILMDMAFHKMQTLKKGLMVVQEKMKEQVDNGMIELGEKGFNGTAVTGWNSGATEGEFNNAVRLATGEMLGNLSIDDETGEIYYMEQAMADTSEEAYNEYLKEMGEPDSVYKPNEGVLSYEDWAELNENNPQMEATLFSRIQFPGEEDNSLQEQYKTIRDAHEQSGLEGYGVDEESSQKLELELSDLYGNATDRQIRSFLFGGQITIVNDDGKLVRVTPAQKLLIDSGIPPGKDGGTEVEQAQYFSFQQALEELKAEDFSKGSPRREELVDMVTKSAEGYQTNAHEKYLDKEEKANAKRNQSNRNTPKQGKNFRMNRYILKKEWDQTWQPTIDALNSAEENIRTMNGPGGVAIKKVKGIWMTRDENGNWKNVSREYLAEKFTILDLMGDIDYEEDDNLVVEQTEKDNFLDETEKALNKSRVPKINVNGKMVPVTQDLTDKEFQSLSDEDKMKWMIEYNKTK